LELQIDGAFQIPCKYQGHSLFLNYRDALARIEPDRQLYLAVRVPVYESFFQRRFITAAVERYQIQLVIYDVKQEVIVQWL
jgi:hypothetical protein